MRIKLISMGDTRVGKSCLIKRFCEDKFVSKYIPTIGVDYGVKPVSFGEHEVRLNLWDLAGPAEYLEVRNEMYKDAQGCLLVYDTTNRASFDMLGSWVEESRKFGADSMVIFVAGTKADIPGRKVTEEEARDWAAGQGFAFFETSAANGAGVRAVFTSLIARVLASIPGISPEAVAAAVQEASASRSSQQ